MPLVVKDRVQETTTTTGTGTLTLGGAVSGFQTFSSAIGNTNTTYYTIQGGAEWEVGIGTVGAGTLSRDTILESSNSGSAVNFSAGTKFVFCTYPAEKSVDIDTAQTLTNKTISVDNNTLSGIAASSFVLSNSSGNIDGAATQKAIPSGVVVGTTDTQTLTNKTLDGGTVVTANSSVDALRINQTGAGNAILVEDSANPDATPFVVDASGNVGVGTLTPTSFVTYGVAVVSSTSFEPSIAVINRTNDTGGGAISLIKERAGAIVNSGDSIGSLVFRGYDNASFITAARITGAVDGTPGTNDMPGRLVFSTTADGASTPTERMRIDSAGQVGIGTTSLTGYGLRVGKNITGATSAFGVQSNGAIQSDVTTGAFMFRTAPTTQNATFTLPTLAHYDAAQGAFGASSTVTNQYGFIANASLTGATNNFGFYGNIPAATGRWNFFANGTANNAFAGNSSFGTTAAPTVAVDVIGTVQARPAATQDAVAIAGRAGGTGSFVATITPTTLTASRTFTLPDATTTIVGTDTTQTLTNKRVTPRVSTAASSATPTINTDNVDIYGLTAQAVDITSFTTNLSGTPTDGQKLIIYIVGTAARAITWGASFESSTVTLPTTTVSTNRLDVGFIWNAATSKWRCVAVA